jgi:hypothetical protein
MEEVETQQAASSTVSTYHEVSVDVRENRFSKDDIFFKDKKGKTRKTTDVIGKDLLTKEEFVGNTTGISVMTIFWMIELDETEIEVPSPLPSAFAFH